MLTRVYSYGCKAPSNIDLVRETTFLANRYRNKLVELERLRRDESNRTVVEMFPDLADLKEQYESLDELLKELLVEIKKDNSDSRSREQTADVKAEIRSLRSACRESYRKYSARKKEAFSTPEAKAKLAELHQQHLARWREARSQSGLYWGTYMDVEKSASQLKKGPPPRFHRFERTGKVAIWIGDGGMPLDVLLASSDKRLALLAENGKYYVQQRIGTDQNKEAIYARAEIKMHRPLPPGCTVTWGWFNRNRIATNEKWEYQFVVNGAPEKPHGTAGSIAVDINWRIIDGRIRVAWWRDSYGTDGQLWLPRKLLERELKCRELQSIRDRSFDDIRAWLKDKIDASWPKEILEKLVNMSRWKSQAQLASVVIRLRESGVKSEVMDHLEAWRKQDKHLYDWQEHNRRKMQLWRREIYRTFAAWARQKYKYAIVEDIDWKQMQDSPLVEDAKAHDDIIRMWRKVTAPGTLSAMLKADGAVEVKAENTTILCHLCGNPSGQVDRGALIHTCKSCGKSWDQDMNAACNILDRGCERDGVARGVG